MTLRILTVEQQLEEVESIIRYFNEFVPGTERRMDVLKAVAQDLRGRQRQAPGVALVEIGRKLQSLKGNGDAIPSKIGLADEVVRRWPTIRRALERFEREVMLS